MKQRSYSSLLVILLAFTLTLSITAPAIAYSNSIEEVTPEGPVFEYIEAVETLRGPNQAFPRRRFVRRVYLGTEYAGFIPLVRITDPSPRSGNLFEAYYHGYIPPYRPNS